MSLSARGLSIPARVRAHAERAPDAIFCTVIAGASTRTITFAEFYAASCGYALDLQRRGIGAGDVVPIMLPQSLQLMASFLGVMLAGAIPTFMPFPSPKQRSQVFWSDHDALFARVQPRAIVTYAENVPAAGALSTALEIVIAGPDLPAGADRDGVFPGLHASPEAVACLQHSSGTTGLKKGVMLTHRAIAEHVETYAATLGFGADDCIASWLPLYHDMGFIACFMLPLIRRTRVIALDPFEWVMRPTTLFEAIEKYRATFCWLPNFAFAHLIRTVKAGATFDLGSMRAYIDCSEPCKPATLERFAERFAAFGVSRSQLQTCYAMAENVFAVTQTALGEPVRVLSVDAEALSRDAIELSAAEQPAQQLASCGKPLSGVHVRVVDRTGRDAAENTVGEIQLASSFAFSGYYRQPELSEAKIRDGWYATGDLGVMHAGELFLTGRIDDMLIVNGRNYYAHEIEALVGNIAGVIPGRCSAIAIDDATAGSMGIVILAEFRDPELDLQATSRAIRECVQERLGFAVNAVTLLPPGMLEKTTSGKMSRVRNKQRYVDGEFAGVAASV